MVRKDKPFISDWITTYCSRPSRFVFNQWVINCSGEAVKSFVVNPTRRKPYETMYETYDVETGFRMRNEPEQQSMNPKMKHDEDMAIKPVASDRTDAAVDHVDTRSNFVFSGFHELNLFILLKLENKLLQTRRKLYHANGTPKTVVKWEDEETEELQRLLKQYRNTSNFCSNSRRSISATRLTSKLGPSSQAYCLPHQGFPTFGQAKHVTTAGKSAVQRYDRNVELGARGLDKTRAAAKS